MSTLKVGTIQDTSGGNSVTPSELSDGIARAAVEFSAQGSTSVITSYNVSSVTYRSTGNYTVNFSSSFSNTNYITVGTSGINRDTYADGLDDIDNTPFILNKNVAFVYVGPGDLDDGANDNQDRVSIVVFHP